MDPLPIFEPGDMPSMVGANVELAADVEERPKKYIRGASARVPAWTFGRAWAKHKFPSTWHKQRISGTFSRMIEPEYGLFVWEDGDAPGEAIESFLAVHSQARWKCAGKLGDQAPGHLGGQPTQSESE